MDERPLYDSGFWVHEFGMGWGTVEEELVNQGWSSGPYRRDMERYTSINYLQITLLNSLLTHRCK